MGFCEGPLDPEFASQKGDQSGRCLEQKNFRGYSHVTTWIGHGALGAMNVRHGVARAGSEANARKFVREIGGQKGCAPL